jgi:hypothetical protein
MKRIALYAAVRAVLTAGLIAYRLFTAQPAQILQPVSIYAPLFTLSLAAGAFPRQRSWSFHN